MLVARSTKPQPTKRQYPCDESPHQCPYNSSSDSMCAYWCRLGEQEQGNFEDYITNEYGYTRLATYTDDDCN